MTDRLNPNVVSTKHPHEPATGPIYDIEGRCLVCSREYHASLIEKLEGEIARLEFAIRTHHSNIASLGLRNGGMGNEVWGGPYDWELWSVLDLPVHPPQVGEKVTDER